jgi:hypothetical protein
MLYGRGGKAIRDDIEKTEEELRADQQHLATMDEQLLECQRILKTIQPAVCLFVSLSLSLASFLLSSLLATFWFRKNSKASPKIVSSSSVITNK